MKERPIIFSSPMVRAILEGRKTQTRRVLKRSTEFKGPYNPAYVENHKDHKGWAQICPHGSPGDTLWVREAWGCRARGDFFTEIEYRADGGRAEYSPTHFCSVKRLDDEGKYRPSIHMPRWAARLFLKVSDVRVERLQDISEQDAKAEGVRLMREGGGTYVGCEGPGRYVTPWPTAKEAFLDLWDSIHGVNAWKENPWVYALTFERIEQIGKAA